MMLSINYPNAPDHQRLSVRVRVYLRRVIEDVRPRIEQLKLIYKNYSVTQLR